MSVINNMLLDLDKRQGRTSGEVEHAPAVRSVETPSPWRLGRSAMWFGMAMLVLVVAGYVAIQRRGGAPVAAAPAMPAASMAAASSAQSPVAAPEPASAAAAATAPAPAVPAASAPTAPESARAPQLKLDLSSRP